MTFLILMVKVMVSDDGVDDKWRRRRLQWPYVKRMMKNGGGDGDGSNCCC